MTDQNDTYAVKVSCANCGRGGSVAITATQEVSYVKCPVCRTRKLAPVAWCWPWQRRFAKNARAFS